MDSKFRSHKARASMITSLGAALALTSLAASADKDKNDNATNNRGPKCEQPTRICFSVPGDPAFAPLPYDGELVLVTTEGSTFTTLIGKGEVSAINGLAMSPASEIYPNPPTPAGLDWYSSPVTGTSYQLKVQSGRGQNTQQCSRIQYSLDSIGAFTQELPPNPLFASVTQTVHSQMSLVYDPNDGTATISQQAKATRACYKTDGTLGKCEDANLTSQQEINRIFPAQQMNCNQIHTPKLPPLFIP